MILPLVAALAAVSPPGPELTDLRVSNGSAPFAGDRALLTTVSPNGDGFRDAAVVRFRLSSAATVRLAAVATQMVRGAGVGDGELSLHRAQARIKAQPRSHVQERPAVRGGHLSIAADNRAQRPGTLDDRTV